MSGLVIIQAKKINDHIAIAISLLLNISGIILSQFKVINAKYLKWQIIIAIKIL